jgi:D-tagatose-1,6-bisphosphate aldolase subunit GatZ/KbaZ
MKTPLRRFLDALESNRTGHRCGAASLCTAHPVVLQAALRRAVGDGSLVLIEATSNQVDQFGGYTGMKPADFVAFVHGLARDAGGDPRDVLLGGDHLGPNRWQDRPAAEAMEHARTLVAAYASAGFRKIHLDASMRCADDAGDRHAPLADGVVAGRAADLCAAAEAAWARAESRGEPPVYVIGTEVPVPGGAQAHEEALRVTSAADACRTIEAARDAFAARGLAGAWERVVAVVVQPGVEYGDDQVFDYRREAAKDLSRAILRFPGMVFEAHSTDYQTPAGLAALAEDHFCILKVGPWLTFALREALFALEAIEREVLAGASAGGLSDLRATLERAMVERPEHWRKYYHGSPAEQALKRAYSLSDRSRYYWPVPAVQQAVARLEANLRARGVPLSLLSQYLPAQHAAVRDGSLICDPRTIAENRVGEVLAAYTAAIGG